MSFTDDMGLEQITEGSYNAHESINDNSDIIDSGRTIKLIIDETGNAGDVYCLNATTGAVELAQADSADTSNVIGFLTQDGVATDERRIRYCGKIVKTGWGLTANKIYYLSGTVAGGITVTAPVAPYRRIVVGYTQDDTDILYISLNAFDENTLHAPLTADLNCNGYDLLNVGTMDGAELTGCSGDISQWTNDSGYLTSFTETDPVYSLWYNSGTPTLTSLIIGEDGYIGITGKERVAYDGSGNKVDIYGDSTLACSFKDSVVLIANGAVGAPSLAFAGDVGNGMYYIGANNWALSAGGTKVLDMTASLVTVGATQLDFTTAHGTTLLIDHIGEHTGSHGVVVDNNLSMVADTDGVLTAGRAKIGYNATTSDLACFAHYDHFTTTNYALAQNNAGATYHNAASGQAIYYCIANVAQIIISASGVNYNSKNVWGYATCGINDGGWVGISTKERIVFDGTGNKIDIYGDSAISASFVDGRIDFTTAHGTTLLIDHIGEHTAAHTIFHDNDATFNTKVGIGSGVTITYPLNLYTTGVSQYCIISLKHGSSSAWTIMNCYDDGAIHPYMGNISAHPFFFITNNSYRFGCGANGGFSVGATYYLTDPGSGKMIIENDVGVGVTSPSAKIHALKITEQLRLGYDVNNYASFTVGIAGNLTVGLVGTTPKTTFSQSILVADKILFTQTDGNEYIDSLADGYMDYGATTGHRFDRSLTLADTASLNLQEAINFTGLTTENKMLFPDNKEVALSIGETGFGNYMAFDSRDAAELILFSVPIKMATNMDIDCNGNNIDNVVELSNGASKVGFPTGINLSGTGDLDCNGGNIDNVVEINPSTTQTYTITNASTDRTFDCDTVLVAELADVVATLISDLNDIGLVTKA